MKTTDKKETLTKEMKEYLDIVKKSTTDNYEWRGEGDYFTKYSVYDSVFSPVPSLGGTTPIKKDRNA